MNMRIFLAGARGVILDPARMAEGLARNARIRAEGAANLVGGTTAARRLVNLSFHTQI